MCPISLLLIWLHTIGIGLHRGGGVGGGIAYFMVMDLLTSVRGRPRLRVYVDVGGGWRQEARER